MKTVLFVLTAMFVFTATDSTFADINYVDGYYRSNGSYVQGHYKDTSADGDVSNNRKQVWGY
jgi:hypothetical protein